MKTLAAGLTLSTLLAMAAPALASGPPPTGPWAIDAFGGDTADQARFYGGQMGVLTPLSPRSQLFAAWRLLHGLPVGQAIGKTLAEPCCGETDQATSTAAQGWL